MSSTKQLPPGLRFAALALALVAACGDDETTHAGGTTTTSATSSTTSTSTTTSGEGAAGGGTSTGGSTGTGGEATGGSGGTAPFAVSVPNHQDGAMWDAKYECTNCNNGGQNTSPELAWTAGPAGTLSYAVVMRDLDFMNGFVHWALWDIPANELGLPEAIPAGFTPGAPAPAGCHQAGSYLGMCSCNSVNTYQITVYAIDAASIAGLDAGSTKADAAAAIEAAAIASATISGES